MSNRKTKVEPTTEPAIVGNTVLAEVPVRIQRSRQHKQVSPNVSGSFCQTAVMCWAVYQH